MTNIIPQSPASNQKGWERLEDYSRHLANEGKVLYIACGPAGEEIGKGRLKVTVPNKIWKVVLVLPSEDAEPRKNSRVIAACQAGSRPLSFETPFSRSRW